MPLPLQLPWEQAQNRWKSQIDPIIANPMTNPRILTNILLINGSTTINHGLQAQQQGWFIVDQDAQANIYRSQPLNDKTITLTSDADVKINLVVF